MDEIFASKIADDLCQSSRVTVLDGDIVKSELGLSGIHHDLIRQNVYIIHATSSIYLTNFEIQEEIYEPENGGAVTDESTEQVRPTKQKTSHGRMRIPRTSPSDFITYVQLLYRRGQIMNFVLGGISSW